MLIPLKLKNDTFLGNNPVTSLFFCINSIIFFYLSYLHYAGLQSEFNSFFKLYAVDPKSIFDGKMLYTLLTSLFIHPGIVHLVFNNWFLLVFGGMLERSIGSIRFALFYAVSGILSMLVQSIYSLFLHLSKVIIMGASGALLAVMGLLLVLKFNEDIVLWFVFTLKCIRTRLYLYILAFSSLSILCTALIAVGYSSFVDNFFGSEIAWHAHASGFVVGILTGWIFLKKRVAYKKGI